MVEKLTVKEVQCKNVGEREATVKCYAHMFDMPDIVSAKGVIKRFCAHWSPLRAFIHCAQISAAMQQW